jgi:cytochrome b
MREVAVWDVATRVFHWLLVMLVVVCLLSGEDEGLVFVIHAYAGFAVMLLLFFRAGWGVIGSRHSRFADFIYPWSVIWRYTHSILRLKPERYIGHNPLGGWMIVLMLLLLLSTSLTGVVMVVTGFGWLEDIHEVFGSLMQVLVFIHILGVVFDQLLTGEKVIKAMITGRKKMAEDMALRESHVASVGKALILAAFVLIVGGYLFQAVDFSHKVSVFSADHDDARKSDDDD